MKTNRIATLLGVLTLGITATTGASAQTWIGGSGPGDLVTNGSTSQVGILTSSPTATLDVNGNVNIGTDLTVNGTSQFQDINVRDLNVNRNANFNMNVNFNDVTTFSANANFSNDIFVNQNEAVGHDLGVSHDLTVGNNITANGTVTAAAFITSSDARLKENIVPVKDVLAKLESIQPVYFTYNNVLPRPKAPQLGFIAQEVQKEFPALVTTMDNGYLGVAYGNMAAVAIEAVKEQQKTIQQLTAENKTLSTQLQEQSARIARMEQMLLQLTGCCPEPVKSDLK